VAVALPREARPGHRCVPVYCTGRGRASDAMWLAVLPLVLVGRAVVTSGRWRKLRLYARPAYMGSRRGYERDGSSHATNRPVNPPATIPMELPIQSASAGVRPALKCWPISKRAAAAARPIAILTDCRRRAISEAENPRGQQVGHEMLKVTAKAGPLQGRARQQRQYAEYGEGRPRHKFQDHVREDASMGPR
jgi:hypothetical protein